tara:strand:- start:2218 stop:2898 length:681 start_codon:yes stop_codon:yes gene_type:complete
MEQLRVLIGIPVFNEEDTIVSIVSSFEKYGDVFVFDDGSTDTTLDQVKKTGCKYLSSADNKGYDNALIEIFKFFKNSQYTHLITADGDEQHTSSAIIEAVKCIDENKDLRIAVGQRNHLNRLSEHIFSLCLYPFLLVSDPLSGLKIYEKEFICKFLPGISKLNFGTSLLFEARSNNISVACFNIQINKRLGSARVGTNFFVACKLITIFLFYFRKSLMMRFKLLNI